MKTRYALIALLVGFLIAGSVDAYFQFRNNEEPVWWVVSSTIAFSVIIFAWYYFDSDARSFPRSKWLNIGIVGFAVVAVPYYIFRSTEQGRRAKALFKFAGFVALCICCQAIGQFAGATVG